MEINGYLYFFGVCGKYIKYFAVNKKDLLQKAAKDEQLRNLLIDYNPIRVKARFFMNWNGTKEEEERIIIQKGIVILKTTEEYRRLIKQNEEK